MPSDHPEFRGATTLTATQYEGYFVYGPQDTRGRLPCLLDNLVPQLAQAIDGNPATAVTRAS